MDCRRTMDCHHVMPSGERCKSPAMRGTQLCYFHSRLRRVTGQRCKPGKKPLKLPFLEDRVAIQLAVSQILDAIAANTIDPRRASLMLRALQIGSQLFRYRNNILPLSSVDSVTQTADGEDLADDPTEIGKTENQPSAAAESEEEPEEDKRRGNGLERLEEAADRRLGQSSEVLADLLLERANEGRVGSAQLLATLVGRGLKRNPPEKKKKRSGPSWAELLASEPEWVEPEEGDVWVGNGWKNPKTGEIKNV